MSEKASFKDMQKAAGALLSVLRGEARFFMQVCIPDSNGNCVNNHELRDFCNHQDLVDAVKNHLKPQIWLIDISCPRVVTSADMLGYIINDKAIVVANFGRNGAEDWFSAFVLNPLVSFQGSEREQFVCNDENVEIATCIDDEDDLFRVVEDGISDSIQTSKGSLSERDGRIARLVALQKKVAVVKGIYAELANMPEDPTVSARQMAEAVIKAEKLLQEVKDEAKEVGFKI